MSRGKNRGSFKGVAMYTENPIPDTRFVYTVPIIPCKVPGCTRKAEKNVTICYTHKRLLPRNLRQKISKAIQLGYWKVRDIYVNEAIEHLKEIYDL